MITVYIRTWEECKEAYGLHRFNNEDMINCAGDFTETFEHILPKDRLVELKLRKDEYGELEFYLPFYFDKEKDLGFHVSPKMVEEVITTKPKDTKDRKTRLVKFTKEEGENEREILLYTNMTREEIAKSAGEDLYRYRDLDIQKKCIMFATYHGLFCEMPKIEVC